LKTGGKIHRSDLGLPGNWETVSGWLDGSRETASQIDNDDVLPLLKNIEVPVLSNYEKSADESFWKSFPSNYPTNVCKKVNVEQLKTLVHKNNSKWSYAKQKVAKRAIDLLEGELPVVLNRTLKSVECKNANSALENGKFMTDAICSWVKKKFVAGPFPYAPLKGFRVNPLMAAVQKTKVRPIMNLSSPKGNAFNEALDMLSVQKLTMSSPKLFAESLIKAGQGAIFAKSDIQDAYKLIPVPVSEWRYYGFKWLGKVFFDTTLVFGSKCAPANFDCVAETVVNIVCAEENLSKNIVHRQLDDVPVVSASGTGMAERFDAKYREVCKKCNIPLAENCPDHEKAFEPSTYGTVLGVVFDSESMEWSLSGAKERGLQKSLDEFLEKKVCTLKDIQKLHGKLANFAQICEFMKGFRFNLLKLLGKFEGTIGEKKLVTNELKHDLWIWKKTIGTSLEGLPLGNIYGEIPLVAKQFISDAAGAAFEWTNGKSKNITVNGDRGVASIEYEQGKPIGAIILRWPDGLLTKSKDRKGAFFGSKSGTLEMVGLLLPFLSCPKKLIGHQIVLEVDNMGVVYGWRKRQCKGDAELSLLIRCLHVLEALLECKIYVTHVKRCSTHVAILADNLSRKSTSTSATMKSIEGKLRTVKSKSLENWLQWPTLNWELPQQICEDVKLLLK